MGQDAITSLYRELRAVYGPPAGQWKLWCKRPKSAIEKEEIMIGAILTQRTNWNNVEMAIDNLKRAKACSFLEIYNLGWKNKNRLARLIKSSGFYQQKTACLFGLAKFVLEHYGSIEKMRKIELNKLRKELLNLNGIGPETADSILLYALEKSVFVIDEYTKRLVKRYRLTRELSYVFLQELFEKNLPRDYRIYQDFHALIVIEEKTHIGESYKSTKK